MLGGGATFPSNGPCGAHPTAQAHFVLGQDAMTSLPTLSHSSVHSQVRRSWAYTPPPRCVMTLLASGVGPRIGSHEEARGMTQTSEAWGPIQLDRHVHSGGLQCGRTCQSSCYVIISLVRFISSLSIWNSGRFPRKSLFQVIPDADGVCPSYHDIIGMAEAQLLWCSLHGDAPENSAEIPVYQAVYYK